jgi:radical SAM-linked protein
VASEAEYVEIALASPVDVEQVRAALDAVLPDGLDLIEAVAAHTPDFTQRLEASTWRLELSGVDPSTVTAAIDGFLATTECFVQRLTKDGRRQLDARAAVLSARVIEPAERVSPLPGAQRAIMELAIRAVIPTVRPDDVLEALRSVAGLALDVPPRVVRLAQGPLDGFGAVGDPFADDRVAPAASS